MSIPFPPTFHNNLANDKNNITMYISAYNRLMVRTANASITIPEMVQMKELRKIIDQYNFNRQNIKESFNGNISDNSKTSGVYTTFMPIDTSTNDIKENIQKTLQFITLAGIFEPFSSVKSQSFLLSHTPPELDSNRYVRNPFYQMPEEVYYPHGLADSPYGQNELAISHKWESQNVIPIQEALEYTNQVLRSQQDDGLFSNSDELVVKDYQVMGGNKGAPTLTFIQGNLKCREEYIQEYQRKKAIYDYFYGPVNSVNKLAGPIYRYNELAYLQKMITESKPCGSPMDELVEY